MSAFANIWKIKELKSRILFTLGMVVICRLITSVPTPGVDIEPMKDWFNSQDGEGFSGMFNMFTGGALSQCSIGMLSIWPYITASIVIQLMTAIVPSLEKMAREGDVGRQKLNQVTRYLTLCICAIQAYFLARMLENPGAILYGFNGTIVANPGFSFQILTVIVVTAATMLTMWLAEQITERGIGNGTSIIIMVNIIARLPVAIYSFGTMFLSSGTKAADKNIFDLVLVLVLCFFVFAGTIALTQGVRRIPICTARRSVGGRSMMSGNTSYMPLRVNFGGVMPIIFAGPILMALGWVLSKIPFIDSFGKALTNSDGTTVTYIIVYSLLIVFFSFFWVATQFHAIRIADDLKNSQGYIPGIRPGRPTAEFLDMTMTRVTLIGAIGLVIIAVLPMILHGFLDIDQGIAYFMGGTSLLIIVGVALDVMRQIEAYLVMQNYDGFLKHGKLRGRR